MHEILLGSVTLAAVVRSTWLLIGLVRNPMYLGIILIWFGIASAFQSAPLLAAAVLYIVPVFWFYIRAEERMMSREFGVQFEDYQRRVGRLVPRLRRPAR